MHRLLGVQSELSELVQKYLDQGCEVLRVCDEVELVSGSDSVYLKRVHLVKADGSCFDIVESEGGYNYWPHGFYVLTNLHIEKVE
jgi:hypothetical protein